MILKHLSQADLIKAVGTNLLSRLEQLLPALTKDELDQTEIYKKDTLIRILMSFAPSQRLRDREFMSVLLNSVPRELLDAICKATGVGVDKKSFSERVSAIVSRGWSKQKFCESFVEATGLPKSFIPIQKEEQPFHEICQKASWPYKRLKTYQNGVYEKALDELKINLARFVIQMPTGAGKTRTAMEIISDFINAAPADAIVVWLAHSEELIEQAVQCFRDVWTHIGSRDVHLFRCYGASATLPFDREGTLFIFGGFQKLHSILKKNPLEFEILRKRTHLLIIDETHKVMAPTYQDVVMALIGDNTRVVGLTATPGRSAFDISENARLSEFFFNRIIGIESPGEMSVFSYLRSKHILAHVVNETLTTSQTYSLTKDQLRYLEQNYDFSAVFLKTLSADDIRNFEIIKKLLLAAKDDRRILFFACNIEHSQFICALLTFFGISASHVDGQTPRAERGYIIDAFKDGQIQVLCNYGVLSTGFDAPKIDVVFIARPTASIVLYSQMIGRGLRGPAIGGTESCTVITVKDNIVGLPEERNIYDYFEEYWTE